MKLYTITDTLSGQLCDIFVANNDDMAQRYVYDRYQKLPHKVDYVLQRFNTEFDTTGGLPMFIREKGHESDCIVAESIAYLDEVCNNASVRYAPDLLGELKPDFAQGGDHE